MAFDTSDPNLVGLFLEPGQEEFDPDQYDKEKKKRKLLEDILSGGIEPDEEIDSEFLEKAMDEESGTNLKHLKGLESDAEKKAKYGDIPETYADDSIGKGKSTGLREYDLDPMDFGEEETDSIMKLLDNGEGAKQSGDKKITVKNTQITAKKGKNKPVKVSTEKIQEFEQDPFEKLAKKTGKKMTSESDRPVYEDKLGLADEKGVEEDPVAGFITDMLTTGAVGGLLKGGARGLGKLLGKVSARGAGEAAAESGARGAASQTPRYRFDLNRSPTGDDLVRGLFERNAARAAEAGGPDSMAIRGAERARRGKLRLRYGDHVPEGTSSSSDAAIRLGDTATMNRSDAMRAAKRIVDQVKKGPGKMNRASVETQLRNLGLSEEEIMRILNP